MNFTISDPAREVIGCTRLSSSVQTFGYGQGAQVTELRAYARTHGLTMPGIIHEVQSGADTIASRDVVQDYYRLARAHRGVGFVFPRVDRLGRLAELIITIARELIARHARVYVVGFDKPLDPQAPEWLMFQFKALMAEQNYVGLIDNLQKGKADKASRGLWASGRPPWGYRMVRDELGRSVLPEPDPALMPVIQRVYELSERHGKLAVAGMLQAEGHPAPTPAGWQASSVEVILRNPRYMGFAMYGAHVMTYPAMVSPEQAARAQAAVRERRRHRTAAHTGHLLTGLALCPACGAAMTWMSVKTHRAKRDGTGEQYGYYRCWQAAYGLSKGRRGCSNMKYHRDTVAEAQAWAAFCATMTDPEALGLLYAPPAELRPDHSARIEQIKEQMGSALTRAVTAGLPDDVLERTLKPLRAELGRLEAERAEPSPLPTVDLVGVAADWQDSLPLMEPGERQGVLHLARARFVLQDAGPVLVGLTLPA